MMDERRGNVFGLGGQQSSNFKQLSPYLNVDPSYLQTQAPEFIMDQEMSRGRLENSFTAIGTSLFVGGVAGGASGLFSGIKHAGLIGMTGKSTRTVIINHAVKSGGSVGNSLGAITLMYSGLYCLMAYLHEDDSYEDAKSCLSGALTGALYKSSGGLKNAGIGGAFGLGLAALWSFGIRKNETVANYV